MKKLIVMAVVMGLAVAAQASATYKWSTAGLAAWDSDNNCPDDSCYTGQVTLYAYLSSGSVADAFVAETTTANNGTVSSTHKVTIADCKKNTDYSFFISYTSNDHLFTSNILTANHSSGAFANIGNFVGTEGSGGTWTELVPEPTSGVLMLLGLAGLALKRKRA